MHKRARIHGSTLAFAERRREGARDRAPARDGAAAVRGRPVAVPIHATVPLEQARRGVRGLRGAGQVREARARPVSDTRAALLADTYGFMVTQAIGMVARAGIADLVADGHETIPELAAETGLPIDSVRRILRALAVLEIFSLDGDRVANTPKSELLRAEVPGLGCVDRAELRERALQGVGGLRAGVSDRRRRDRGRPRYRLLRLARRASRPKPRSSTARWLPARHSSWRRSTSSPGRTSWSSTWAVGPAGCLPGLLARHPGLRGIVVDLPHSEAAALETFEAAGVCRPGDLRERQLLRVGSGGRRRLRALAHPPRLGRRACASHPARDPHRCGRRGTAR